MRNITLSADATLIEKARELAQNRKTTLNNLFREWLTELARQDQRLEHHEKLMKRLQYVNAGGKFTREEFNAR